MPRMFTCVLAVWAVTAVAMPVGAEQDTPPVAVAVQQQTRPKPAPAEGKQPTPKPAPEPTNKAAPNRPGQLANVRLEVTITDQRASGPPTTKTVALVLADRANGRIRTMGDVLVPFRTKGPGGATSTQHNVQRVVLNVDAYPEFTRDGRVRAHITLEYRPVVSDTADEEQALTTISETFTVILDDGKPLVVSQSADPTTDRRVRVEVKATILK